MSKVQVELETTEHRVYTIGKRVQVSATFSYKFIEKDNTTGPIRTKEMFLLLDDNGITSEIPLGDSKIPPRTN